MRTGNTKSQQDVNKCQGWEFALWFFEKINHFLLAKELPSLFCKEHQERSTHGFSFILSDESEMLPSHFKKERRQRFALRLKKGKSSEKLSKTYENTNFFERIARV